MKIRKLTIFGVAACVILPVTLLPRAVLHARVGGNVTANQGEKKMNQHPYLGMWVTVDGRIHQELLPNGRYDEARGSRNSAYQGRYAVNGSHIDYWDDTGFTADGEFVTIDELHHGGMIFFREK